MRTPERSFMIAKGFAPFPGVKPFVIMENIQIPDRRTRT
jgi:hypothetical protein